MDNRPDDNRSNENRPDTNRSSENRSRNEDQETRRQRRPRPDREGGYSRRPRREEPDNKLIKIIMLILALLLVGAISVYAIKLLFTEKPNSTVVDSQQETRLETKDESKRETQKETVKETEKETVKETQEETRKETEKETIKETEKETKKETEREVERPSDSGNQNNQSSQVDQNKLKNFTPVKVGSYKSTATVTVSQIQNANIDQLVDMIIQGKLGYGWERVDLLQKAGLNPEYVSSLVNAKLKKLGY
ncbi:hypothetical protein [uncultured Helcococcus sp.]|uniref:hypothetical protein n=1 Tax=uncultured Helcococcus sp. TaxID=1072508 RepID=UPI00288B13B6|nr:hypothetical protein [uncultured Helcococcus sp.]